MSFTEFDEDKNKNFLRNVAEVVGGYSEFLTDKQRNKIYDGYKGVVYDNDKNSRNYGGSKQATIDFCESNLEFLKYETYDSKRYKSYLVNTLGFDAWIVWIFDKVLIEPKITGCGVDLICVSELIKEFFIDKNIAKISKALNGESVKVSIFNKQKEINKIAS